MNKKLLWGLIILVVVVIALVALKKGGALGKEEGTKVTAEKVSKRTIMEIVTASGKIYPEVEVKVSPDISGEIVELNVQEGDSVKRGQVLAKIYADLYATQRDQASAEVTRVEAMTANSTAELESLKSTLDQAQNTFNRQKKLLDDKVISKAEFEQAETTLRSAQANYNAAIQSIRSSKASEQSARANLSRAYKDLGRTTIVSPMSGVISLLSVKKGERVAGNSFNVGTEMMRVADMSVMEVRVDVGENDVPKVHYGDSALVEVDAYNNRKFKGIVTQIASSSKGTSQLGQTSNDVTNYEVRIRLLPSSYQDLIDPKKPRSFPFRPGMNASADIQTKRHENVLSVPINAVTTREKGSDKSVKSDKKSSFDKKDDGTTDDANAKSSASDLEEVVYITQPDGKVKKVVVKTDIQDINYIEITSGLKEGEEVVTGPYTTVSKTLKDGTKVKVVPKEQLFDKK